MNETITTLGLIDDEAILLDEAALELAALDHPDIDLDPYQETLDALAERLADVGGAAGTDAGRSAALARVMAAEFGFSGDIETYDDPANADLIRVIDRRRGLPVSLSILYVAVARRLGWTADALATPGHMLISVGVGPEALVLDPFRAGGRVASGKVAELMGGNATPPPAMSNRAVLVRLLLNQATRAEAAGDSRRALTLFDRMAAVAPDDVHTLWERARLQLVHGQTAAARAGLGAILEVTREPVLRARVGRVLDRLAGMAKPKA